MAYMLSTASLRKAMLLLAGALAVVVGIRIGTLIPQGSAIAARPARASPPRPVLPPAPKANPTGSPFTVKRILDVPGPIRIGDYVWDDQDVPPGPLIITVDIAAGTLSAFRNGYEIGTAAILYGIDSKPTPLGVFPILQKDAHHRSNLYDAAMPFMMRLTSDGVSIHGSEMKIGWGTNGCIGVPIPFAKRLFEQARIGDRVIITNGKTLEVGTHVTRRRT